MCMLTLYSIDHKPCTFGACALLSATKLTNKVAISPTPRAILLLEMLGSTLWRCVESKCENDHHVLAPWVCMCNGVRMLFMKCMEILCDVGCDSRFQ